MKGAAPSTQAIEEACLFLSDRDVCLAQAMFDVGSPEWRTASADFETLARAIVYQLVSTKAASAIWSRVHTQLQGDVSPDRVVATADLDLRACGVSRPKVQHMRAIAESIRSGALCFDRLGRSDIETARKELLLVRGIGPWTADLFLMNALGHLDAFPHGDVGVMEAYRLLQGRDEREPAKDFLQRAEAWRPYRGVAAHLLWKWIHQWRDAAPA
ncbi:MAG: DNA-3-methyladenine glycosylase 2 family protein [Pseudomonadota bacterium]